MDITQVIVPFNGESDGAVARSGQEHLGDGHCVGHQVDENPEPVVGAHLGQREADVREDEVQEVHARQANHQLMKYILKRKVSSAHPHNRIGTYFKSGKTSNTGLSRGILKRKFGPSCCCLS